MSSGSDKAVAFWLTVAVLMTVVVVIRQQWRIDTLARQVEILERNSVHHGARLDAQQAAGWVGHVREADKPAGQAAARLPGWVDAMPV
jgi:hypothetical protein